MHNLLLLPLPAKTGYVGYIGWKVLRVICSSTCWLHQICDGFPPNSHYQLLVTGDLLKQINQRRYEIGWCYLDLSGYPGWPPGRSFFQRSASWWTPVYTKCLVAWLMEQGQGSWIRICPKTWDSRKHAHLLFIFQLWQSCARFANKESVVTSKGFQLNQEHQEGMSQININSQFVCRRSTISMKIERRLQEPFNWRDSRYCMFLCVIVRIAPISASGRSAKKTMTQRVTKFPGSVALEQQIRRLKPTAHIFG